MKTPALVIMAAGMGSRYGGLKQMDPIDELGNSILHYSVYDAVKAGFRDIVFVIRKEHEEDFRRLVTDRLEGRCSCLFAFQDIMDCPEYFEIPEGRVKPWGTGHAVRACREVCKDRPFVVINADDYYGSSPFREMFSYLSEAENGHYAMSGYLLRNTTTKNGHVARGVCETDPSGFLQKITERTMIEEKESGIAFSEDGGSSWTPLDENTPVSMNFWGFTPDFMTEADQRFDAFLAGLQDEDKLKKEYFLPGIVEQLLVEGKCDVRVIPTREKWYGVTYKEDKESVVKALKAKRDKGEYEGI